MSPANPIGSGPDPTEDGSSPPVPSTDTAPTTSLATRALRPVALVLLVGGALYLAVMFRTARREAAELQEALHAASAVLRTCRQHQQRFEFQVRPIGRVLYQLQTAEALSKKRAQWAAAIGRSLNALPSDVYLTEFRAEYSTAPNTPVVSDELVFGMDLTGYRAPPPPVPIKARMECRLPGKQAPLLEVKQLREAVEATKHLRDFSLLDSGPGDSRAPSQSSISFDFTITP